MAAAAQPRLGQLLKARVCSSRPGFAPQGCARPSSPLPLVLVLCLQPQRCCSELQLSLSPLGVSPSPHRTSPAASHRNFPICRGRMFGLVWWPCPLQSHQHR